MLSAKISRGFKNSEYPLLGHVEIHIALSVCPYFELDNEQDEVRKASLIKQ